MWQLAVAVAAFVVVAPLVLRAADALALVAHLPPLRVASPRIVARADGRAAALLAAVPTAYAATPWVCLFVCGSSSD